MLPSDFQDLARASTATALFFSNVYFWRTSSYFDGSSELKPLLHTWSLGVEEQFYIVFPVIVILAFRYGGRRALRAVVLAGLVGSFALSVLTVREHASAAFYLAPLPGVGAPHRIGARARARSRVPQPLARGGRRSRRRRADPVERAHLLRGPAVPRAGGALALPRRGPADPCANRGGEPGAEPSAAGLRRAHLLLALPLALAGGGLCPLRGPVLRGAARDRGGARPVVRAGGRCPGTSSKGPSAPAGSSPASRNSSASPPPASSPSRASASRWGRRASPNARQGSRRAAPRQGPPTARGRASSARARRSRRSIRGAA